MTYITIKEDFEIISQEIKMEDLIINIYNVIFIVMTILSLIVVVINY